MEEEKVVDVLYQVRDQIKVDETLKVNLRKSFRKKRKPLWKRVWMYSAVAAIILFSFLLVDFKPKPVDANVFKITNSLSLLNIGSGEITAMTHHNGNLYISLPKKGIFIYTQKGLEKISKEMADDMSIDANGKNLLISEEGSVALLNLKKNQKKILLGSSSSIRYSHPIWKDDQTIYAVQNKEGKEQIIEFDLQTQKEKVVTKGSMPAYIVKGKLLVFERDGKIMSLNERNGAAKEIDRGINPAISPDGKFISYVKASNGIEDVWVTDIDLIAKKKITTNPVAKEKSLYQYSSPEWSSSERGLFVVKQRLADKNSPMQIMKINLGEKELDAKQTVNRFLQAVIVRDDDYAKTMMKNPPEFLTISNPHQSGYQILSSNKEKDGVVHVKAEVNWSYTANPYYRIATYDFELIHGGNGYVISKVTELDSKEVMPEINSDHVQLIEGDKKETLFSLSDIPQKMMKDSNYRLATLALDQKGNKILFTVQELQDGSNQAAVNLLSYDLNSKAFTFLDRVESIDGHKNIGVSAMSLSGSGKYIALDLFLDEPPFSPYVYVYDIQEVEQLKQFKLAHSVFWQGEQLFMQKLADDQFMILQRFDPTVKTK
ncbi:hypothetical protein [Neobacillus sp. PS3-40]|uniref:hypothetical protein n=1 Tax=Neobacillus sp. PS3-40 TaxID=3070679 RepID=UPI0027DEFFBC|nr:hypothetical protein [Neobacillus sp. PS3-40]WML42854.1 hypothetical protein RCG20_13550 [Neobacillus sp. PS3-40]